MPIYEYECRRCGGRFELVVLPATKSECPSCQSTDLERLLSLFSVSSDATRAANLNAARRRQAKLQRDKSIAEHEAYHHHEH